ncbi:hypothetical protein [Candidatus Symbiobacter mobilis]|uniref:Uncharacterized protein n=1 Tax=Candidatus Symbiobacter mobilis CR TaxID=946483 RepID=U5NBP0_9BURK|nr:hypothetical protein [Candidatus Symbiobacter mobilis]AGX88735.1 hypothetical protein Cenrod_2685 [Candidatus Symbiobacter mobilis CR]
MSYTNGSKDGYNLGYSDALAGKKKNPVSLLEGMKQALRPQTYTETFLDGYSQGWRDGNRKRNGV